jgi:hypothetical protein
MSGRLLDSREGSFEEGRRREAQRAEIARMEPKKETTERNPGVCIPFEEKKKEWPPLQGDEKLVRRIWESNDSLAYIYIWHCLLSF